MLQPGEHVASKLGELMGIYTRRGDSGQASLADGSRTSKASLRIDALGALDETSAAIGLARQAVEDSSLQAVLLFIEQRVFNCSAALASPIPADATPAVSPADVAFLETAIDHFAEGSGEWRGFVLASGGEAAARLHFARTLARQAERRIVALAESEDVAPELLAFANRLSDLLFTTARAAAARENATEDFWDRDAQPPAL
jgi:cob(I)alamin adenosyltransferase